MLLVNVFAPSSQRARRCDAVSSARRAGEPQERKSVETSRPRGRRLGNRTASASRASFQSRTELEINRNPRRRSRTPTACAWVAAHRCRCRRSCCRRCSAGSRSRGSFPGSAGASISLIGTAPLSGRRRPAIAMPAWVFATSENPQPSGIGRRAPLGSGQNRTLRKPRGTCGRWGSESRVNLDATDESVSRGRDGTRTRDLRRDRPVMARPA